MFFGSPTSNVATPKTPPKVTVSVQAFAVHKNPDGNYGAYRVVTSVDNDNYSVWIRWSLLKALTKEMAYSHPEDEKRGAFYFKSPWRLGNQLDPGFLAERAQCLQAVLRQLLPFFMSDPTLRCFLMEGHLGTLGVARTWSSDTTLNGIIEDSPSNVETFNLSPSYSAPPSPRSSSPRAADPPTPPPRLIQTPPPMESVEENAPAPPAPADDREEMTLAALYVKARGSIYVKAKGSLKDLYEGHNELLERKFVMSANEKKKFILAELFAILALLVLVPAIVYLSNMSAAPAPPPPPRALLPSVLTNARQGLDTAKEQLAVSTTIARTALAAGGNITATNTKKAGKWLGVAWKASSSKAQEVGSIGASWGIVAGTAVAQGAAVAGTAIAQGATVAGTAIGQGAAVAGTSVAHGAVVAANATAVWAGKAGKASQSALVVAARFGKAKAAALAVWTAHALAIAAEWTIVIALDGVDRARGFTIRASSATASFAKAGSKQAVKAAKVSVNATKVGVLKVGLATKGLAKGAKSLAKAAPKRIKVKASEAKGATYSTALNTADAATQVAAAAKAVFNLGLDAVGARCAACKGVATKTLDFVQSTYRDELKAQCQVRPCPGCPCGDDNKRSGWAVLLG